MTTTDRLEIKALICTSKAFDPNSGTFQIGKYTIEPVPALTSDPDLVGAFVLRFEDEMTHGRSNPDEEVRLFLSLFSLVAGARIKAHGLMINSVPVPLNLKRKPYEAAPPVIDVSALDEALNNLTRKDDEIARQCIRAAEAYRLAVEQMGENNALSFFLFVAAIECIANKVADGSSKFNKFTDFILRYLPEKSAFATECEWRKALEEVYCRHRSGFAHGGKDIPDAVSLADRLDRPYVENEIEGKSVRTPSLKWFARVVRDTLLSYFRSDHATTNSRTDHLKKLSFERGVVRLKAKRDIRKGEMLTANDVDLG